MAGAPWWEEFGASAPSTTDTAEPAAPRVVPRAAPATPARTPRRPRGLRGLRVTAAVLGVVLVALLGLLAVRTLTRPGTSGASGGPTALATPVASPAAPAQSPGGTSAADAAATAELQRLRDEGLASHPPQGQWVAQLAAKSVGTTDPVQTAANGSSTFYATDILAQSRQIASGVAGGDVFVLRSTDFGTGLVDARGNPYWATLAAGPFAGAGDVRTWCDSMFARTPAAERGNVCLPKQLTPPTGR